MFSSPLFLFWFAKVAVSLCQVRQPPRGCTLCSGCPFAVTLCCPFPGVYFFFPGSLMASVLQVSRVFRSSLPLAGKALLRGPRGGWPPSPLFRVLPKPLRSDPLRGRPRVFVHSSWDGIMASLGSITQYALLPYLLFLLLLLTAQRAVIYPASSERADPGITGGQVSPSPDHCPRSVPVASCLSLPIPFAMPMPMGL